MLLPAGSLNHLGQTHAFRALEQLDQGGLFGALALLGWLLRRQADRLQAFRGNGQLHAALGCIGVSGDQSSVAQRGEHLDECAAFEVGREVGQQFLRMLGRCFEQAALGVREFHFLPFDVVDVFCAAAIPAA